MASLQCVRVLAKLLALSMPSIEESEGVRKAINDAVRAGGDKCKAVQQDAKQQLESYEKERQSLEAAQSRVQSLENQLRDARAEVEARIAAVAKFEEVRAQDEVRQRICRGLDEASATLQRALEVRAPLHRLQVPCSTVLSVREGLGPVAGATRPHAPLLLYTCLRWTWLHLHHR